MKVHKDKLKNGEGVYGKKVHGN